jgi:GNAT superfamily N-acetyltransferase
LCFGVYRQEKQIGFARVITDEATFAYLCDVFIDKAYRGEGLAKWLMETILAYPTLQGLRRFMLATRDAHGLYKQVGFGELTFTDRWMHIHWPDVYKHQNH